MAKGPGKDGRTDGLVHLCGLSVVQTKPGWVPLHLPSLRWGLPAPKRTVPKTLVDPQCPEDLPRALLRGMGWAVGLSPLRLSISLVPHGWRRGRGAVLLRHAAHVGQPERGKQAASSEFLFVADNSQNSLKTIHNESFENSRCYTHTWRILSLRALWMTVPAVHYPPSLLGEGAGGERGVSSFFFFFF